MEGKKLPELFRKPSVNFSQLVDDALAYSKRNKRSYKTDVPRFAGLKEWFGSYPAEELAPKEIEKRLARAAEKEKWAPSTFNHYRSLMSLSYRLGILNRKVTSNPAVRSHTGVKITTGFAFCRLKKKRNSARSLRRSGRLTCQSSISRSILVSARAVNTD